MTYLSPHVEGGEAERLPPWGLEPGRLWSLWDMLELEAASFLETLSMLDGIRILFSTMRQAHPDVSVPAAFVDDSAIGRIRKTVSELLPVLAQLQAKAASSAAERLLSRLDGPRISADDLGLATGDIYSRLRDELRNQWLLHLLPVAAAHYSAGSLFYGSDVLGKFPCLGYEIDEVGKCLGLERSTAAAFHAIRCLEAAIRALSRCLCLPDPTRGQDRSWPNMLRKLNAEIVKRWPPNTPSQMSEDGQFFDGCYAVLAAMQNPYRNATMHLDAKYTLEEALHVSSAVGFFMKKLASRMDEQGEPKA